MSSLYENSEEESVPPTTPELLATVSEVGVRGEQEQVSDPPPAPTTAPIEMVGPPPMLPTMELPATGLGSVLLLTAVVLIALGAILVRTKRM